MWFAGRLATYRYYNMDQIVGQALATFRRINEAPLSDAETSPARVMKSAAALASHRARFRDGRAAGARAGRNGRQALPKRSQLGRLRDPDALWWATGIEDTFITEPRTSSAGRSMNTSSPGITIDGRRILG